MCVCMYIYRCLYNIDDIDVYTISIYSYKLYKYIYTHRSIYRPIYNILYYIILFFNMYKIIVYLYINKIYV